MKKQKTNIQQLLSWATNNGAEINFEIRERACFYGENSKSQIAFIPNDLLLSTSVAMESRVGKSLVAHFKANEFQFLGSKYPHAMELIVLTVFLVIEKRTCGFWQPYIESLPSEFDLPLMWSPKEIKYLLYGTSMESITNEKLQWIAQVVEALNKVEGYEISLYEFKWAYSAISSRAFPRAKLKEASSSVTNNEWISISEICLYPVLDMLDHNPTAKIEWIMDSAGIEFVTNDPIATGEIAYNNYGPKGNENLLSNYGFVLNDNQYDYVKIRLNVTEDDPLFETKQQLISVYSIGLDYLLFLDDLHMNSKLIEAACVLVADKYELEKFKQGDVTQSVRNKFLAAQTLHNLMRKKLKLVRRGEEKMSEFKSNEERKRMALIYRKGQEKILEHHLVIVKKYMRELVTEENSLSLSHPKICLPFLKDLKLRLGEEYEELDADVLIIFVLIKERSIQENSYWYQNILKLANSRTDEDLNAIMGDTSDFESFYEEVFLPIINSFPELLPPSVFNLENCLWAASIVETNSAKASPEYIERFDPTNVRDDETLIILF